MQKKRVRDLRNSYIFAFYMYTFFLLSINVYILNNIDRNLSKNEILNNL